MAKPKPKPSTAPKAKKAAPKAKPGPGGRPTKYKAEFARQATLLGKKGCTDPEVAEFFGVTRSTVSLWKLRHPEFSDALQASKAEADARVERALFERATGYVHRDMHISNYQGEVTVTPIERHYPPDPASMIFWLKNRKPGTWRDKPEGEDDGDATAPVKVEVHVVSGRKHADAQ